MSFLGFQVVDVRTHILWAPTASTTNSTFNYERDIAPEGIASNVLSARLKLLELHGLISRRPDPDNGRQQIYTPTAKCLDLLPVMVELIRWGAKHDAETAAPASFIRSVETNRQRVIARIRAGHHAT